LEIVFFKELPSTQKQLIEDLKRKKVTPPIAYFTNFQTAGIGSRGNSWIGQKGNFFLSIALFKKDLPSDLPLVSIALYFTFLFKECLKGSKVWLKWPNDLYLEDKKCGGAISNLVGESVVYGVGLNTLFAPKGFAKIDIPIDDKELLECFLASIQQKPAWKRIFSKYKIEFNQHNSFYTHLDGKKVAVKDARLAEDGALILNGERIYSLR